MILTASFSGRYTVLKKQSRSSYCCSTDYQRSLSKSELRTPMCILQSIPPVTAVESSSALEVAEYAASEEVSPAHY